MPPRYKPVREFHIVVMGAGGVGKSSLTAQFVHNEWIESYDPTIEDSYRTHVTVDGRQVVLEILDTAGTEQFVGMRDMYMRTGEGFLLVFSVTSDQSLNEIRTLRDAIVKIKGEDVPIVICGNKIDLGSRRRVDLERAWSMAESWGLRYYETSARERRQVDDVFMDLCRQMIMRDEALYHDDHGRSEYGSGPKDRKHRKKHGRHGRCIVL